MRKLLLAGCVSIKSFSSFSSLVKSRKAQKQLKKMSEKIIHSTLYLKSEVGANATFS